MMTYCKYSSSDCKHQDIQLFQFIHLHPLSPREHIIYAYISIYLKKEKEKRSSSPGNKSLCDVGIRRDSETEVLEMHHILRIQSRQPIQHIGVSLMLLTYSFCFFFFFKTAVLCPSPWSLCLSLWPAPLYRRTVDLRFMLAPFCVSHLARCRRHHSWHPTRHSSVGAQQDLSLLL